MSPKKAQKTASQRVQECVAIRTQIKSMGIEALDEVSSTIVRNMNDFVINGEPRTFSVKVPGTGTTLQVILTNTLGKKSGVTMVM